MIKKLFNSELYTSANEKLADEENVIYVNTDKIVSIVEHHFNDPKEKDFAVIYLEDGSYIETYTAVDIILQ